MAKPSPKAASKAAPKASYGGSDSDSSDAGTLRNSSSRRRTQSDVGNNRGGGGGIGRRAPLARRASNASSVSSGARSEGSIAGGKKKKRGGFFGALKHLFAPRDKESLKRGSTRAASPDSLQHHSSSWSTRTDRNVRRAGGGSEVGTSASGGGGLSWGRKSKASGGRDDSSDDEDVSRAALVAVTNVGRTAAKKDASGRTGDWVVEPVGGRPGIKRSSSSRSTIKGKDMSAVDKSKKRQSMIEISPSTGKALNGPLTLQKPKPTAASDVTSSKALKSTQSNGTLKSKKSGSDLGPAKTAASGVKRSTSTSAVPAGKKAVNGKPAAPPAVPTLVSITAPRSLNPSSGLSLPTAPGSSIVPATLSIPQPLRAPSPVSPPAADSAIKRSSTYSAGTNSRPLSAISTAKAENFHHSPQHRTASPPPRSALRQPRSATELKPSLLGSVPILSVPTAPPSRLIPSPTPTTGDDNESIYETGVEDNVEDDGDATEHERSNVLLGKQLDGLSPEHVVSPPGSNVSNLSSSNGTAILSNGAGSDVKLSRRKSVRIEGVPPSPASESPPRLPRPGNYVPPPEVTYDDTGAPISANHGPSSWSSRIPSAEGGVWGGADSSDDDPDEGEYAAAKRAMERAARKAEKAKAKGKARQVA